MRKNIAYALSSLLLGLVASLLTAGIQLALKSHDLASRSGWFQDFGLPFAWVGIWKAPETSVQQNLHLYFYSWSFIQNCLFWTAVLFAFLVIWATARGRIQLALLPAYLVGLAWARIQLEFQMAVATKGSIVTFARIDPFSYGQITSYFAMALLLFPVIIAVVSGLNFRPIFRLCCLGFPVILLPPVVDNYVLRKPVIYNFFEAGSHLARLDPVQYLSVLSPGIKLEILIVATSGLLCLMYRTQSILRSASAILCALVSFVVVSSPALTSRLNLSFTQPQLFAGYLIMTYVLIVIALGLAQPGLGRAILRQTRLRGIHFPGMALFGLFLVHPTIVAAGVREDAGIALAGTFIVFSVWQVAVVFDDVYDRGQTAVPGYLAYGTVTAVMALLAAIPMGAIPWLLTLIAVYFAIDYPRLRRKHFLFSGLTIGINSSIAFLFGTALPMASEESSSTQLVAFVALAILLTFSGASLLKDVASVEADAASGIPTIFTSIRPNRALPIVATFVAVGFAFPTLLLQGLLDRALLLTAAIGVWFLIVLARERSYRPVLVLYFAGALWVFFRMFFERG